MESIDYKTLLEISQSTATVRTRDELQAFIDERVRPCFGFNEEWNICIYEPVPNTLEVLFTNKITPEDSDDYMKFRSPNPAEGFFKIVLESGEIIHLDESWESVPKTSRIEKIAYRFWQDFNIKYCLSVSLRSFGQVIGTFHTFFKEHKTFTEPQLRLFKALAAQIAIHLVNVLANEKALEREREKALLLSISEETATIRSRADLRRVMTGTVKPMIEFDDAVVTVLYFLSDFDALQRG